MNIKTISLLVSLVSLNTLHANTTKPSSETLYEQAAHSAQKLATGLYNLDFMNAGYALLLALAANQTANYGVVKNRKKLAHQAQVQETQVLIEKAMELTDMTAEEITTQLTRAAQLDRQLAQAAQEQTRQAAEELREQIGLAKLGIQIQIRIQLDRQQAQAAELIERAQLAKLTQAAKELAQQALAAKELAQAAQATEELAQAAQATAKAVTYSLLRKLTTATFSAAVWLNCYNSLQLQAGKKPLEVPLLNCLDFSSCITGKTWSVSVNLTKTWDFLSSFF